MIVLNMVHIHNSNYYFFIINYCLCSKYINVNYIIKIKEF